MSDSTTTATGNIVNICHVIEIALAARTLYGFLRSHFTSASTTSTLTNKKRKPVRVYIDGCFDLMHFGHANALRQASALGDELIVGVCSSAEIKFNKGTAPVLTDDERCAAVSAIKWVDEVLKDAPYVLSENFLNELVHVHHVDLVVHGDDPCVGADGGDAYKAAKRAGRFRVIKRTEGVSSTDVVGRILCLNESMNGNGHIQEHHEEHIQGNGHHDHDDHDDDDDDDDDDDNDVHDVHDVHDDDDSSSDDVRGSGDLTKATAGFLPTSRRVVQFAGAPRAPKPTDVVVYIAGSFDLFHTGHISILQKARSLGDFVLVGVLHDADLKEQPIMTVHERSMMALACKYVDEVIIGAPSSVTREVVTSMNISVVVKNPEIEVDDDVVGVVKVVDVLAGKGTVSVEEIVKRVEYEREEYEERTERKKQGEKDYVTNHKQFVEER